uniref:Uncharacterized protein n=2 Tax=Klebsiella pneumoniae complex TaxID=3390273 RepID=A0A3S5I4E2_KLEPN|nr:hypothetical protein [Klebsiella pneumoniae]
MPLWIAPHGGKNNEICDLSLARHLNLAVKNLPGFGQKINGLIINKKNPTEKMLFLLLRIFVRNHLKYISNLSPHSNISHQENLKQNSSQLHFLFISVS